MTTSLAEIRLNHDGPILAQWARENEHEGRAYRDPETGKSYPSVTTILKNTPKADLARWYALKVAERARDRPDIVLGDPDKVVDRLRYAPTDFRDERGWVGSSVHKAAEAMLGDMWWDDSEFTTEMTGMMLAFEEFVIDYQVKPLLTESTVLIDCGDAGKVMGTLDMLCEITNPDTGNKRISLMDIKTSKNLWAEHEYQLSALRKAQSYFKMVPEGTEGALLHKHPKLGKTWWLKLDFDFKIDSVELLHIRQEGYDLVTVPDLELNFNIYKTYVQLWHDLKALSDVRKERDFG